MKKILILSILFSISIKSVVLTKNELYEKIDLFGEVLENIEKEYQLPIDKYSKQVVLSNLELLFTYSHRYYERQFIVRNEVSASIYSNFKAELKSIFNLYLMRTIFFQSQKKI